MTHARTKAWMAAATVAALLTGHPAAASCIGDCDADAAVTIDELVPCVGVALGRPLDACPACDGNGDAAVTIDELIAAIGNALNGCAPPSATPTRGATPTASAPPGACGNGQVDVEGEQCDDGNPFGGDGCAANCTLEHRRRAVFDPAHTNATVQTQAFVVPLEQIEGSQVLTSGAPRATAVFGPDGTQRFAAGDIPVVIRTADLLFEPIGVGGLVCACVHGVDTPAFGPGNAASGVIACGAEGLADVDTMLRRDHDTSPGSPTNGGAAAGLADDAECDDCATSPLLGRSCACREGRDPGCGVLHDVCNSPRTVERGGGAAPAGSALLSLQIAIGLLGDRGECNPNGPRPDGGCLFPPYGPDCLPCTADDLDRGRPTLVTATTGLAGAAVFDTNLNRGVAIAADASCFGPPCVASQRGAPFSCAALADEPDSGLGDGALAVCFPSVDAAVISDNVTCTLLSAQ